MSAPDVFFSPAPDRVISEMLRIADVGPADVLYDLGCGDGRINVAAAKDRGARGVGLDVDEALLDIARQNAAAACVESLVSFELADLFEADISAATVIALYLIDSLNVRLRPRILAQCAPGTRVVCYSFEMGEWEWDAHTPMAANGVSLWIVPANVTGVWNLDPGGKRRLVLRQRFQRVSGSLEVDGRPVATISGTLSGTRFSFAMAEKNGDSVAYIGTINSEELVATSEAGDSLAAEREPGTRTPLE